MNPLDPHHEMPPATPGRLPPAFVEREAELIRTRRKAAGFTEAELHRPPIGFALSGGGIRSATFCLGLFQSLAKHKSLRHIDYLSTVSGGGYFGGFLGRMFTRPWVKGEVGEVPQKMYVVPRTTHLVAGAAAPGTPADPETAHRPTPTSPTDKKSGPRSHRESNSRRFLAMLPNTVPQAGFKSLISGPVHNDNAISRVEAALTDSQSPPLIWLRESSNYLAPGGANDGALDISIYLRNWLSVLVVLLTTAFTVFLAFNCLRFWINCPMVEDFLADYAGPHLWWTPAILLPVIIAAVFLVPLGMAFWLTQLRKEVWAAWAAYLLVLVATGVDAVASPSTRVIAGSVFGIVVLAIFWRIGFGASAPDSGDEDRDMWIRNHMARWLRVALLMFISSLSFAVIDGWGQSLYAVVSYAGNLHNAVPVLAGVLGVTAIAPVIRSIALRQRNGSSKFKLPLRYLALAFSLVVALAMLTGVAFVSHALAWDRRLPRCPDHALSADSPGGLIYRHWVANTNSVQLTADHLIQVVPAPDPAQPRKGQAEPVLWLLLRALLLSVGLSLLFARTIGFLNLSSYHALYSARIVRAYQGASNRERWENNANVTLAEPDDDIAWQDYQPHAAGGPLHLINSTVNCNQSVETAMESTTAKGLNLCTGPAGISYGQHHYLFTNDFTQVTSFDNDLPASTPPIKVEPLRLGDWVGISGAAFTTGLGNVGSGRGTSLGTSLLCGFFNVRLGYWWQNDLSPSNKLSFNNFFPVQTYLADEFTADFHIVQRDHWYLSDGGHFENTAAYELIRRRVPLIIMADCGADPDSAFDDIGNLVRRVRIDFNAEIVFPDTLPDEPKLESDHLGTFAELHAENLFVGRKHDDHIAVAIKSIPGGDSDPLQARRTQKHAAFGVVNYPEAGADPSILIIIKPGLTGDEPADLINYQRNNPTFPQQSTAEQFYDEAQWESYRKLGHHIMDRVLEDKWLGKKLGVVKSSV
jgi:hypothetical protein